MSTDNNHAEQKRKLTEKPRAESKADHTRETHLGGSRNGNDEIFILEKIFPNADEAFKHCPTPNVNSDCLVVLDTNTLLLPYNIASDRLQNLGEVYKSLASKNRLFIPQRVAREFIKNRDHKLAGIIQAINDTRSKINIGGAAISPVLGWMPEYKDLEEASRLLSEAKKAYTKNLDNLIERIKLWRGNDPITSTYHDIFDKSRHICPNISDSDIAKDWKYRRENQIPPGYKDAAKRDTGVGDFIIWLSILELGKSKQKDVIFVTGEEKSDWFINVGKEQIYPRPELIDEFRRISGGYSLSLSSLHDLLQQLKAPESLVNDVRQAEFTAKETIKRDDTIASSGPGPGFVLNFSEKDIAYQSMLTEVRFDYTRDHGIIQINHYGRVFDLRFVNAGASAIHILKTGNTIRMAGVRPGRARTTTWIDNHINADLCLLTENDCFLIENSSEDVLAGRIMHIKSSSHGDANDEVMFNFMVNHRKFMIEFPPEIFL